MNKVGEGVESLKKERGRGGGGGGGGRDSHESATVFKISKSFFGFKIILLVLP